MRVFVRRALRCVALPAAVTRAGGLLVPPTVQLGEGAWVRTPSRVLLRALSACATSKQTRECHTV